MASKKSDNKKNQRKDMVLKTLQGRLIPLHFFKRNFKYIIAIVMMMLMYISNKFRCQGYTEQVLTLKTQLENAKTDWVNSSATYNSMIKESTMKAYIDTMHIDLNSPEQPPYHLTVK